MKLLIKQILNKIKPFQRAISIFLDILFLLIWIVSLWIILSLNNSIDFLLTKQNWILFVISAKMIFSL